mmetsp:Transcript_52752/g.58966  ORF Transcript_52752/g.58966 Transcript_52752/m.58966 type:complete len:87 (+) Transcript_52752:158-418(+)
MDSIIYEEEGVPNPSAAIDTIRGDDVVIQRRSEKATMQEQKYVDSCGTDVENRRRRGITPLITSRGKYLVVNIINRVRKASSSAAE